MNTPVHDPENYCPICGTKLPADAGHHCNAKTLDALDSPRIRGHAQFHQPPEAKRLKDGFGTVDGEYHEDNELTQICPECGHAVMLHWF